MATDIIAQGMAGSAMKAVQQAINRIEGLPAGVIYKGSVDYYNNLPANPTLGEAYTVKYTGTSGTILFGAEYAWGVNTTTGQQEWIRLGSDVYFTMEEKQLLQWLSTTALNVEVYGPED